MEIEDLKRTTKVMFEDICQEMGGDFLSNNNTMICKVNRFRIIFDFPVRGYGTFKVHKEENDKEYSMGVVFPISEKIDFIIEYE